VEGRTYVIEPRWAEDRSERLPSLAADLVRLNVDLIVSASGPAAAIAKDATSSIPIVLASSFYPVESGVIASLDRPGGNVTGVTHFTPELMAKRVQLLKELLPSASRFAVLRLPGRLQDLVVKDMDAAARRLGVQLQVIEVRSEEDFQAAFEAAIAARAQAVMSTQGPLFWHNNARIAQLAREHRLPSLSGEPNAAEAGALLFYGPNVFEGCRRAVRYVDRILKGAKPAELPVEQPTKIVLMINLKTAKAIGLTIPQSLLLRADEVIQ
jgi:putative ABC transport system substrate-binding protein